ncbi:MAG: DUF4388 domain-containing protein [Cyanobacteria bacterium REEB67]|nr:DUF4388 domain-containing protein [Cyanobacteria bacterium REEB67]
MQGRNSVIHPALDRIPRPEDLQKLLRAVQSGPAPIQQPLNLDRGRKFILKVQQPRSAAGLGRSRGTNESPLWALCEGLNTIWEYNTADVELIFNLIEEAVYASGQAPPVGGTSATALATLDEVAAEPQAISQQMAGPGDDVLYASREAPQFGHESEQFNSGGSEQFSRATSAPEMRAEDRRSSQTGMPSSGNLNELSVCDLFQSISVTKMTGRLDITSGLESLEVFFEDGVPRRASFRSDSMTGPVRDITGEEVLLEGMTWRNGFFQFHSAMKSTERSPMRRLDLLLLEGAALSDYTDALGKAGLEAEAKPVRTAQLSEADFEKALSEGIAVNMQDQKMFYIAFDGKTSLGDIVRAAGLPKSAWLPLVFNLHKCGMIGLPNRAPVTANSAETAQSPLIKEAVHEAFQELLRPDTGLLSYPLFMHFMEVEFQRALRLRLPFSLLIIKVHKEGAGVIEQLSSEDLKLVAERLRLYLEPYDHIGHYEILDIGVLLPHRPSAQARQYASKFIADFDAELAQTGNGVRFVWSVGIGCIPEDGIKLGAMVSKAETERNQAREANLV